MCLWRDIHLSFLLDFTEKPQPGHSIMKTIFLIGHHDIRLFLKDKTSYIWLIIVPFVFAFFTGMMSGSGGIRSSNPKPSLLVLNEDNGALSELVLKALQKQGIYFLDAKENPDAGRILVIPEGFTQGLMDGESIPMELRLNDTTPTNPSVLLESLLVRGLMDVNGHWLEWVGQDSEWNDASVGILNDLMEQPDPVQMEVRYAGTHPIPTGYGHSLPANVVMFLLMNLMIFGGASIGHERQVGVMRRLAVQPIHLLQLVLGKVYGRWLLGCVMIGSLMGLGSLVFGVSLGTRWVETLIVLLVFAWMAASLGVLMGALSVNPDKIPGICVLISLVMAALGGCWWPLEIVPDALNTVGHAFPTAWAMDALHQTIHFGAGFERIWTELAVLLGFAVALNILASKFFRFS